MSARLPRLRLAMGPARGAGTADVVVEIVESTLPKVDAVRQKLVAALQRVVGSGIHYYLKYYFSAVPSTGGGALSLASAALVRNYLVLEVAAPYSSDFFFFLAAALLCAAEAFCCSSCINCCTTFSASISCSMPFLPFFFFLLSFFFSTFCTVVFCTGVRFSSVAGSASSAPPPFILISFARFLNFAVPSDSPAPSETTKLRAAARSRSGNRKSSLTSPLNSGHGKKAE